MKLSLQVAFITGQSDPASCALSPVQERFLDALPISEAAKVRRNFPYAVHSQPYQEPMLLRASWHNTRQYFASRRPAFAERSRPAVLQMLARANCTVLLAGSCGLELLANLRLPAEVLANVRVFAYGAVVRRRPVVELVAVRGRRDLIASRMPGAASVDCNHLSYLESPAVLAICAKFVAGHAAH
ncbi:MAG: hypothetical protein JWM95_5515 [Gemmatimonadetes bacterium]|nr:hypothetical protein [Gemmatimonadota bacterium]